MAFPKVSVIILNWNGWRDTLECLESLYQIEYDNYEVILLDNGSVDSSLQEIRKYVENKRSVESKNLRNPTHAPLELLEYTKLQAEKLDSSAHRASSNRRLILIKNDKNYGFAEGNNIGIRFALRAHNPDYILLLNNDTVVDRFFLKELVEAAERDDKIGFVGPKIYYYDYHERSDVINVAGSYLDMLRGNPARVGSGEIDRGQYDKTVQVDYVEGSCLLIKKDVLDKIGLLNSKYFAYWEETDLCRRGSKAGYKSIYCHSSKIWHKIKSQSPNPKIIYYLSRNKLWFMKEHATKPQLMFFLFYFLGYSFWVRLKTLYSLGRSEITICFIKGVFEGLKSNGR
jgi:GT2 family glycosyltransferase